MAPGLTEKGAAVRARIVTAAAELIRDQGVAATSLDAVRARAGVGGSQLSHYFPDGKAGLLLAVARHEADELLAEQEPHLSRLASHPSHQAWQDWTDTVYASYLAQGSGCHLSALMAQLDRSDPAVRAVTAEMQSRWMDPVASGVAALQRAGLAPDHLDPAALGTVIVASIQGGVVIMLSTGDVGPLRTVLADVRSRLQSVSQLKARE